MKYITLLLICLTLFEGPDESGKRQLGKLAGKDVTYMKHLKQEITADRKVVI